MDAHVCSQVAGLREGLAAGRAGVGALKGGGGCERPPGTGYRAIVCCPSYRGTSLARNHTPVGPYRRPMPRVLGCWAFSYERGTPVHVFAQTDWRLWHCAYMYFTITGQWLRAVPRRARI